MYPDAMAIQTISVNVSYFPPERLHASLEEEGSIRKTSTSVNDKN